MARIRSLMPRKHRKTFIGTFLIVLALLVVVSSVAALPTFAVHVVGPGESLEGIALHYGVSIPEVARANNIYHPDLLYPGQRLIIPGVSAPAPAYRNQPAASAYENGYGAPAYGSAYNAPAYENQYGAPAYESPSDVPAWAHRPALPAYEAVPPASDYGHSAGAVYKVRPGDTLSYIARRFGTTVGSLAMFNNIWNPNLIHVGQRIVIPGNTSFAAYQSPVKTYAPPQQPAYQPAPAKKAAAPLKPALCNDSIKITFPRQGEVLDGIGSFHITGTASIDDFQFYKLELGKGEVPIEFWSIDEVKTKPIINGILLRDWNTGALPEGTYTLRLTAVDNQGQFPQPCNVIVHIDH